jgi:uroporphyrinogen-III synthase
MGPEILVVRSEGQFSALLRDAGFKVTSLELIGTEPLDDLHELNDRIAALDRYDGLFFTSPAAAEVFVKTFAASAVAHRPKAYVLGDRTWSVLERAGFEVSGERSANTAAELIGAYPEEEFAGKRFLFVRGNKSMGTVPRLLNAKARVDEVVVYRTAGLEPNGSILDSMRERLQRAEIGWVCFFSPSGVQRFNELFGAARWPELSVAAIGETTASAAEEGGFDVKFVSQRANTEEFAGELIEYIKRID